jgi:hypothetical protein
VPSLQIRDLPDAIYRVLSLKARRERRSLARQAVIELERMSEVEARNHRLEALRDLRERILREGEKAVSRSPAEIVREDRDQ